MMSRLITGEFRIWLILLGLGLLFGSAFLCVKLLVNEMSTLQIVAGRLTLGALAILGLLAARKELRRPSRSLFVAGSILGVTDAALPYGLIVWAQQDIDSGLAAVLLSTMPFFTLMFAVSMHQEELFSIRRLGGLALGLAGVWLLAGPQASGGSSAAIACIAVITGARVIRCCDRVWSAADTASFGHRPNRGQIDSRCGSHRGN